MAARLIGGTPKRVCRREEDSQILAGADAHKAEFSHRLLIVNTRVKHRGTGNQSCHR